MQVFFFHLMPYAALDPATETTHDSAWVTLPNSHFDPAIGADLYNSYMDQLEYADALGFDGIGNDFVNLSFGSGICSLNKLFVCLLQSVAFSSDRNNFSLRGLNFGLQRIRGFRLDRIDAGFCCLDCGFRVLVFADQSQLN